MSFDSPNRLRDNFEKSFRLGAKHIKAQNSEFIEENLVKLKHSTIYFLFNQFYSAKNVLYQSNKFDKVDKAEIMEIIE